MGLAVNTKVSLTSIEMHASLEAHQRSQGTTRLFDGGNTKFSTSLLPDIGKAVVGVLRNPEETKNRAVYIQSASTTQNELLAAAKRANPDFTGLTESRTTAKLEEDAYNKHQSEDSAKSAIIDFIVLSVLDPACGSSWNEHNDNRLLGIQEMSQADLDKFIAQYVSN